MTRLVVIIPGESDGILGNDKVNGMDPNCNAIMRGGQLGSIDDVVGNVGHTYTPTLPLQQETGRGGGSVNRVDVFECGRKK